MRSSSKFVIWLRRVTLCRASAVVGTPAAAALLLEASAPPPPDAAAQDASASSAAAASARAIAAPVCGWPSCVACDAPFALNNFECARIVINMARVWIDC